VVAIHGPESGIEEPLLHLATEGGDTLWASTQSGTLVRLIGGRAASVVDPDLRRALALQSVVLVVGGGALWLGTAGGIGRIPLASLHAAADGFGPPPATRWFGPSDGLPIARTGRFQGSTGARAGDGRIWFTTPAGLAVVDPDAAPFNTVAPTPRIEGARIGGRPGSVSDGSHVDPRPDRLELDFTAGALRTPERTTVEYRLDGADEQWIDAAGTRTASYSRLGPGAYRFRVRARNEDDIASLSEATLSFRVLPAWYQGWWFLPLAALGIAGAGAMSVGMSGRASRRAESRRLTDRYEAALHERTRMAQDLHDTLLQGFVGVTLHLQALERQMREAPEQAGSALGRVLSMADDALREGRRMVWDMRAPELEGHDLAGAVETAARRAVEGLAIRLDFQVSGVPRPLAPPLETTVLRVAREAVSNVVRHANASELSIRLSFAPDAVALFVRDDGTGFEPSRIEASGHWGLVGMSERAVRAGGRLRVHGAAGAGTTLELSLPTGATSAANA
jgi:signal transduction histidine kinase